VFLIYGLHSPVIFSLSLSLFKFSVTFLYNTFYLILCILREFDSTKYLCNNYDPFVYSEYFMDMLFCIIVDL